MVAKTTTLEKLAPHQILDTIRAWYAPAPVPVAEPWEPSEAIKLAAVFLGVVLYHHRSPNQQAGFAWWYAMCDEGLLEACGLRQDSRFKPVPFSSPYVTAWPVLPLDSASNPSPEGVS